MVWALPFSLAATQEIDFSFFSSGYLDVSVPRVPSACAMYLRIGDWSSTSRVSPFGYQGIYDQGIYACLRLPLAFRSLPRPSSALGALASTLCSCSLDYVDPETRYSNFRSIDFPLLQLVFQDFFLVFLFVQLSRCAGDLSPLRLPSGILKTIQTIEGTVILRTLWLFACALPSAFQPVSFTEVPLPILSSNRPRFEVSGFPSTCSLERR